MTWSAPGASDLPQLPAVCSALCATDWHCSLLACLAAKGIAGHHVKSQSTPTDPSSLLDISSASAAAVPGMRDSSCASGGTDSSSALVERERSPPANRRALARTPRKASSPYPSGNIPADDVPAPTIVHNQMLNIGASPQQVLAAQQFAAGEAANRVAAQAELLHQASMSEVQGPSSGCVE